MLLGISPELILFEGSHGAFRANEGTRCAAQAERCDVELGKAWKRAGVKVADLLIATAPRA